MISFLKLNAFVLNILLFTVTPKQKPLVTGYILKCLKQLCDYIT